MQDYEKLGVFYLGRVYDPAAGRRKDDLLLYDSRDLLTHAVCVGMTGSGKTGLGLALLEEAAIDGIPAIAIDPKGDLGNLLLTFPGLAPADFLPWIDAEEASRQGISPGDLASSTAERWRKGLADWGQAPARIARFRDAVDAAIYTPGSSAGIPLSVLRSLGPPPPPAALDEDAASERITATVSGLLSLVGVEADPIRSREHILVSNVLDRAWREGKDLGIGDLVRQIQSPPLERVGVVDLESFFPAKERQALAMAFNNLLASPRFASWMEGEPLDVGRLLYTPGGKPRLAVLSIAHLSDTERMFFVTLLLGEVIAWMRSRPGTTSLRAILYMDEVFGYFPPTANPPSKTPMLTLLKQARAYGLGVVLATQNPVDLDYKGLGNAGTWFLGRLQTERDKLRVLDGLEGASAASGRGFDRARIDRMLSGLGNRVFLMSDVHEDAPVLFESRFTLSYLAGPLSRAQIQTLMAPRKDSAAPVTAAAVTGGTAVSEVSRSLAPAAAALSGSERPLLLHDVPERFLAPRGEPVVYRPGLLGTAKVHYVDAKAGIDLWEDVAVVARLGGEVPPDPWEGAEASARRSLDVLEEPPSGASFASIPAEAAKPRSYAAWSKKLAESLYRGRSVELLRCPALTLVSSPGESEGDFRVRVAEADRARRDGDVDRLRKTYSPRLAALEERIRRSEERVRRERAQVQQQTVATAISVGATVLGALFGRKVLSAGTLGRATTAARGAGRVASERQDVARASESVEALRQRLLDLQSEFDGEVAALAAGGDRAAVEKVAVRPRKSDLIVEQVLLLWLP
ncbi:MAG: ATP-binding protein [Acidobacteriia bacterium]|nr:ATP-binding protein [Terriglobia bacterium]